MTLTRASKNNLCPVCYSHKSCSYDEHHNRYFCFFTTENTPEFTLLKVKNGFGIFRDNSRVGAKYKKHPSTKLKGLTKTNNSIPTVELNTKVEDNNRLIKSLSLLDKHRKALRGRGLSDEQIDALGFKSIKKWQQTQAEGVAAGTTSEGLWVGATGLLIPIYDVNELLLGWQIRPDFVIDGAKYLWSKCYKSKDSKEILNTSHITYGGKPELPLQVSIAKRLTGQTLYLTEGVLKPYIFHARQNVNVVGAAGGLFESSPTAFTEILTTVRPSKVVYAVDAGSGLNPNVVRALTATAELVYEVTGKEMMVLDYGQSFDKSKPDPDEIDSFTFEIAGEVTFKNWKFILSKDDYSQQLLEEALHSLKTPDVVASVNNVTKDLIGGDFVVGKSGSNLVSPKLNVGRAGYYYTPETHQSILSCAYSLGYKAVLDISGTGKGKSHLTGLLDINQFSRPGDLAPDKIFYISAQHRNPTTETIERNFIEHPTKNAKLYTHPDKKTALGNPVLMRTKQGRTSLPTPGNCHLADTQQLIYNSGSKVSLCGTCKFKELCANGESPGEYGYKYQVKKAMASEYVRANINGLNFSLTEEEKEELGILEAANRNQSPSVRPNDIAVVDEYTQTLDFVKSYTITLTDWISQQYSFRKILGDSYKYLEPINNILNGKVDVGIYGWNMVDYFRQFPARAMFGYFAQEVAEDQAEANFFELESGGTPLLEFGEDLLKALSGQHLNITLTFHNGKINVYKRDDELLKKLNRFGMVVYLDATSTKQQLATLLGCDLNEILLISQRPSKTDHVTLRQCVSLGALGCNRSAKALDGINIARESLIKTYGEENVGFIDWKRFAQPGDLYHFVDGRGSNAFKNKKAVVSFGIANTNVTAARAIFEVTYGQRFHYDRSSSLSEFNNFYVQLQQAEVEQELGRLRASRRENEELYFYSFSTFDLSFLVKKGYNYEIVRGFEIDHRICNTKDKIIYAVQQLASREELRKMSLSQFAKFANINRSTLASAPKKDFSSTGSWYAMKEALIDLVFHQPERLVFAIEKLHKTKDSDKMLLASNIQAFKDLVTQGLGK